MNWVTDVEIARQMRQFDRYIITTHLRADGDAIGSACAALIILDAMGKRADIVLDDDHLDSRYDFLPALRRVTTIERLRERQAQGEAPAWSAALILDAPVIERVGRVQRFLPGAERTLVIDHHATDRPLGGYHYMDAAASSTCEMVYKVMRHLDVDLTPGIATALYAGIAFDTGRFRFSNTTPDCLHVSGELVRAGADPLLIANRLFHERSVSSIRMLTAALASLEIEAGGRLASFELSHDNFVSNGQKWTDLEGFIDFAISIQGVEVAAFYKELRPGFVRISLRSHGHLSVRKLAALLGGGGHDKAAGCQTDGRLPDVRRRFNNLIVERLNELDLA